MGYRAPWRYGGSKRCPIPHSWQPNRLDAISLMIDLFQFDFVLKLKYPAQANCKNYQLPYYQHKYAATHSKYLCLEITYLYWLNIHLLFILKDRIKSTI